MSALFTYTDRSNITTHTKHVVTLKFFQGNEGTSAKYNTKRKFISFFPPKKKKKKKKLMEFITNLLVIPFYYQ
jgi:hypothetical protein